MELLQVRDLSFQYPDSGRLALNRLNFSVNAGEFVILCGASGCGKSTLLKLLKKEVAPAGNPVSGEAGGRAVLPGVGKVYRICGSEYRGSVGYGEGIQ